MTSGIDRPKIHLWRAFKKKRAVGLECSNRWQYRCVCKKEWFRQERGSSLPAARGSWVHVTWLKATKAFKWEVLGHPSYSPDLSPCDYAIFWPPKKGSEGQTIHFGRRSQAVRAELVHNAAPGILPPCVAVGQVPQQPGPILLTYRYWFLFLGLWLGFFNAPYI